jgi:hypothetical protein
LIAVKLDLSKIPTGMKSAIMHHPKFAEKVQSEPNQPDMVIIQGENESNYDIENVKRKIKDILIHLRIRDFVAITDPGDRHKILIIKKKDAEKLDSFHCHHCGMEFIYEIQLGIHQRLHFPF